LNVFSLKPFIPVPLAHENCTGDDQEHGPRAPQSTHGYRP
jgi:hypothetical protein